MFLYNACNFLTVTVIVLLSAISAAKADPIDKYVARIMADGRVISTHLEKLPNGIPTWWYVIAYEDKSVKNSYPEIFVCNVVMSAISCYQPSDYNLKIKK